jgi:hypothetical protein
MGICRLDASGSEKEPVAGSCEDGNEPLELFFIKEV